MGRREFHDEGIVGGYLQWDLLKWGDCLGCFGVDFFQLEIVEVSVDKMETVLGGYCGVISKMVAGDEFLFLWRGARLCT